MGPMAEIGWIKGPSKIEPIGEHQPGPQAGGQAKAVAVLPARDQTRIGPRPARIGRPAEPGFHQLGARRQTLIDSTPGHPASHQLPELATHRLSLHTEDPIRSAVMT